MSEFFDGLYTDNGDVLVACSEVFESEQLKRELGMSYDPAYDLQNSVPADSEILSSDMPEDSEATSETAPQGDALVKKFSLVLNSSVADQLRELNKLLDRMQSFAFVQQIVNYRFMIIGMLDCLYRLSLIPYDVYSDLSDLCEERARTRTAYLLCYYQHQTLQPAPPE